MGRKRYNKGGGDGMMSRSSPWMGFLVTIFGAIAMLIDLIIFSIALDSLDTAYTAAATYTEQVGLTSVMGIWPLVLFVIFMAAGLAALAGGAIMQAKKAITGGWMDVFLTAVMGGVALIISALLNTTIQAQLHTAYAAAACTTSTANIASFAGLLSIMTVFGMVIFLSLMGAGIGQIAAAAYGGYKHLAGRI